MKLVLAGETILLTTAPRFNALKYEPHHKEVSRRLIVEWHLRKSAR